MPRKRALSARMILTTQAALPLAQKINSYLVEFRQNLDNSFKNDPAFY